MSLKDRKHSAIKFYQEDIVQHVSSPQTYGIILRCWHDVEEAQPPDALADPIMRPLKRGEVGISFFPSGTRDILPETDFTLVDRTFQLGDYCKRAVDDVRSGVVTSIRVEGRLEHAISGQPVEGWTSMEELETPVDAEIGDYVVYDDWIGQIIESFDEAVIEVATGQLVRLPEFSSRLSVGDKGNDILPSPTSVQSLLGFFMGSHRPSHIDTVVAVKRTVFAVCWLAVNQSLEPSEAQNRKRPQRFWFGEDLSKLTMVRGKSQDMRVGDRVVLKDHTRRPFTTHGQDNDPASVLVVRTLVVKETRTSLNVLWQDGSQETLNSKQLIPHMNPDEYDCWPGDHVIWKGEDETRAATIQSVNAAERTAMILYSDTGVKDTVSVLELDPHGTTDLMEVNSTSPHEGFGVRRGEFVFVHREGTTNGLKKPRVPRIGEVETWVQEGQVDADGQFSGWRKEMSEIGTQIATQRAADTPEEGIVKRLSNDTDILQWIGEVTGLHLDGTVEVTHPNTNVAVYPLERLTRLYDSIEQFESELWGDELSDTHGSYRGEGEEVWTMDQDGVWQPQSQYDGDEWVGDDDGPMDIDEPGWAEDEQTPSDIRPSSPHILSTKISTDSNTGLGLHRTHEDAESSVSHQSAVPLPPPDVPKDVSGDAGVINNDNEYISSPWKRFDILSSAPIDHAFYASSPAQPSKSFLARLTREYRVLESSLPESIIVRAYEDRGDLLRSVIIGPENTPYEDAPFVIDWMLDSNFPHSPPIAHFLSWTNGNGRVNPNLYEDGKICLSILGTWAGDRNETWSAARSSLLQAFVSIQGLVLVKEPWFCEPAYEKLRGTDEGIVNSRLYSEKAYVLSRGFVRRALEIPLGGLESEFHWLYYTNKRLEKVIREAHALIEKSKASDNSRADQDLAVPRLTGGGIITLDRTLNKLKSLLQSHIEHSS